MSKSYLTKADLLAGVTLKPQDFEVEGLGWVQVRGLSMNEASEIRSIVGDNEAQLLLHFAHRGLVNPQFSLDEVQSLGDASVGFITALGRRVTELCGLGDKKEIDPLAGNSS